MKLSPGAILSGLGVVLGWSWEAPGAVWASPGASWDAPGVPSGAPWASLGVLGSLLRHFGHLLGRPGMLLGRLRELLGRPWGDPKSIQNSIRNLIRPNRNGKNCPNTAPVMVSELDQRQRALDNVTQKSYQNRYRYD